MKAAHLRHGVAVVVALLLVVAFVNAVSGGRNFPVAVIIAAIIALLIVFEVRSYRPKVDRNRGTWSKTAETFRDPITGEPTDVFFNAETGERDYRRSR